MLQYDLSETNLARGEEPPRIPTEGELLAVMIGLMLVEDSAFGELRDRPLTLTQDNCERVATCIEMNITPLLRDIGSEAILRSRLNELVGVKILLVSM